ncbi:hypothetical protein PAXRUDRAFT_789218 [Paxillus rubicundulus Ve08.2h10]|uniref:Uncharacterized protein n=1 Tax=Paxillus rubicundulus Ve08.2h10 TaxID=930991 RepID=A0A0D0E684_9AGAM|nr:hypothetical protein PAXRUDRAFT_789218 [Paxillus rubicundulus Ve08.2h10]
MSKTDDAPALLLILLINRSFGSIACDFQFPSQAEKIIWRVASLALIVTPCLLCLAEMFGITDSLDSYYLDYDDMDTIRFSLLSVGVLARLVFMVLMFASLRDLPAIAYETVSWTVYIPHLWFLYDSMCRSHLAICRPTHELQLVPPL